MRPIFLAMTLLVFSVTVDAAVTYRYSGNPFDFISDGTVVPGTYDSSHRLIGEFILSGPLLANMPDVDLLTPNASGIVVVSFNVSDGRVSFDYSQLNLSAGNRLRLVTDEFSRILNWEITLASSDVQLPVYVWDSYNLPQLVEDRGTIIGSFASIADSYDSGDRLDGLAGTWTAPTSVPTPSAWALFLSASGILGLLRIPKRSGQ